ncbi:hypothetical protein L1049_020608 [Liquidambar formosana]|uniref:Protein SHORTAGE IN CHIASMATA 1 n=1 Tax=Liquidambar formosana TaxID=63359 RepID=A0AAP0SA61_LIQFO
MRTRFLNIDYFNPSSIKTLETLNFLHLPVHDLPPCSLSSSEDFVCCFDSVLSISPDVETLPVDTALSKFLSDVLPQIIDVPIGDFPITPWRSRKDCDGEQWKFSAGSDEIRFVEKEDEVLYEEKEVDSQRNFGSESIGNEFPKKRNETTVDDEDEHEIEAVQFEIPQMDQFLENDFFSEKDEMLILSEVPEVENTLDVLIPGLQMQYSYEVQESVYSIKDITSEYCMEQNTYLLEDAGSIQGQNHLHHCTFPLLEVDEISLGILTSLPMEDELPLVLENIEPRHYTQKDNLMVDGKELLGSVDANMLDDFSDHCLMKCAEYEMACPNIFLEMDFISITETSHIQRNSAFHQGTSDGDSFFSVSPVLFQEFQILDLDLSQFLEIFSNSQTIDEPDTCDQMFKEDMNLRNFNELIVSHELVLIDDAFKSLPIPVLLDHENIRSLNVIVEEILAELKPLSLSASDGIYLDWHLLEEEKCNHDIYSTYQSMLEVNTCSIDSDLKFIDDGKWILDFIFAGDTPTGPNTGESKEVLNLFPAGVSMLNGNLSGVSSSKLLGDGCAKWGNGELLSDSNTKRVSLLFESMSKFNDLEFFLNPQKATAGGNSEPAVKAFDFTMARESHENMNEQKLEEFLNFVPVEAKFNLKSLEAADNVEACSIPLPVSCAPADINSKQMLPSMPSFADTVIIVNTQNFDKEMIISRRSTYQRILSIEKEGAQVVERDLNLPADVIISAAICLVWYDCRNIGKKNTTTDEASSCFPLCVENIATNVLTSLSFAFSGCILVFEGENSFLSAIMEWSDALYAAAASLRIDLQLFYSYSSEFTDEIVLSCIGYATKFNRCLYSKMPESETLAESFLTKFPSINPLSAHAILSSGGMLIEFLEWSHEHRIRAIQKYHIPEQSVTFLSSLCRYGEREDSKSGMTECSSSVSSAPDSEYCHCKIDSERKQGKFFRSPQKMEIPMDDLLHFEPLNQFMDGGMDTSSVSKLYDSHMSNGPDILGESKNPSLSLNDKLFVQKQGLARAMMNDLDWHDINKTEVPHENFIGEVIDLNDSSLLDEDFSSIATFESLSPLAHEIKKDPAARNTNTARRVSFGSSSHPTFPTASEINCHSDIWSSIKDHEEILGGGINPHPDTYFDNDIMILKNQRELVMEDSIHKSVKNFNGQSFQEKGVPRYSGTPFSNALRSAQSQQGSPWTIEFLNRIREKSRLRQQSLPCDSSSPCFGYPGNISKITKRKSPSILGFYKYQGGCTSKKTVEQKRQNRFVESSSSSMNEKTSVPLIPTWTPPDKRARRVLYVLQQMEVEAKLSWSGVMEMLIVKAKDSEIEHDMAGTAVAIF